MLFVLSYLSLITIHVCSLFKHKEICDQESAFILLNCLAHVCDPLCSAPSISSKNPLKCKQVTHK